MRHAPINNLSFLPQLGRKARLEELSRKHGASKVHVAVVDTTDEKTVAAWADSVKALLGKNHLDILVNNSGVTVETFAPLWEVPQEECFRVINTNVLGYMNVVRHFVPFMIESDRGVIVNVSSGQGRAPNPILAPYAISKVRYLAVTSTIGYV